MIRILIYLNESKRIEQNKIFQSLYRVLSADERMDLTVLTKSSRLYETLTEKYAEEQDVKVLHQQALQMNQEKQEFDLLFHLNYESSNAAIPGVKYRSLIPFFPKEALDDLSESHALLLSSYILVDSLAAKQVLENMEAFRGDILYLPLKSQMQKPSAPLNRRNLVRIETGKSPDEESEQIESILNELLKKSIHFHSGAQNTYYRAGISEDVGVLYNPTPKQLEVFYQLAKQNKPVIIHENDFFRSVLGEDYPLFISNLSEMKEKLVQLMGDSAFYTSSAEAGRKVFERNETGPDKKKLLQVIHKIYLKEAFIPFKPRTKQKEKKTILFAGHDFKFLTPFIETCQQSDMEVLIDQWDGHKAHDEEKSFALLKDADLIFCEWGLGNAVFYSEHVQPHQELYIRVHRQELETEHLKEIDYSKVTAVISISPYMLEEFQRLMEIPREKLRLVPNMMETEKFKLPKQENAAFHLGIIGVVPKLKRLDRAVDIFEKLWQEDNRYQLHIKGKLPQDISWMQWRKRSKDMIYFDKIFERIENAEWKDQVVFSPFGSDIAEWLTNIGIILSTSDLEAFHLAPMEGMASGAAPVIFRWKGAELIYPDETLVSTVDEAVERIKYVNAHPEARTAHQDLPDHYDVANITAQLRTLLGI